MPKGQIYFVWADVEFDFDNEHPNERELTIKLMVPADDFQEGESVEVVVITKGSGD